MKPVALAPPSEGNPFTTVALDNEGARYVRFLHTDAGGGICVFFGTSVDDRDPRSLAATALSAVRALAKELEGIASSPPEAKA